MSQLNVDVIAAGAYQTFMTCVVSSQDDRPSYNNFSKFDFDPDELADIMPFRLEIGVLAQSAGVVGLCSEDDPFVNTFLML